MFYFYGDSLARTRFPHRTLTFWINALVKDLEVPAFVIASAVGALATRAGVVLLLTERGTRAIEGRTLDTGKESS